MDLNLLSRIAHQIDFISNEKINREKIIMTHIVVFLWYQLVTWYIIYNSTSCLNSIKNLTESARITSVTQKNVSLPIL